MKKLFMLLLAFCMISTIVGCKDNSSTNEEDKNEVLTVENGTEVAKILLANHRLDSRVLEESGTLFTDGKKALATIVNETRKHLSSSKGRPGETYTEVEGDTYKWYNDNEYSNFMSYFDSYAVNIEHNASSGSDLIDYTKKYIRVVNKWVKQNDVEYYLEVTENSETIFKRDSSGYEICKRYTDENGNSVYEMFMNKDNVVNRMKYVPGLLYEFVISFSNTPDNYHYLFADNSKGYWTILSSNGLRGYDDPSSGYVENFSTTMVVLKDEANYKFNHMVDTTGVEYVNDVSIISEDRKTDLVTLNTNRIELFNTGVKGLNHIEITAPKDKVGDYNPDDPNQYYVYEQLNVNQKGEYYNIYSTSGYKSATAVLENGMTLTEGDVLLDGKVEVRRVDVSYVAGCDSYGVIPFYTRAKSYKEQFEILEELLEVTGLTFRRDYDVVVNGLKYALKDVENYPKYYTWNGYHINDINEVKKAILVENDKINAIINKYNEIKDSEVIDINDQEVYSSNIHFADMIIVDGGTITNDGFNIEIKDFKVKVEDTLLFVDKEKYKVVFALMNSSGDLISYIDETDLYSEFIKGEVFETVQTKQLSLPLIEEGNYVLVAYVALASEGIRITNFTAVTGNIVDAVVKQDGLKNTLTLNQSGNIVVNSLVDYNLYYDLSGEFTYEQLLEFMSLNAYEHGMIDEQIIEKLDGESWVVLESISEVEPEGREEENTEVTEEVEVLEKGQYRMKYIAQNNQGEAVYVYVTLN